MVQLRRQALEWREEWSQGRGRPPIAELVGPTGAGKSTLLHALLERHPNIRPMLRTRVLGRTPAIARDLASFAPTALAAIPVSPVFVSRNLRLWVRLETRYGALRQERPVARGPVVFEHGPVYTLARLSAFHRGEPLRGPVASYLGRVSERWAEALDVVIWLDAPIDVLMQRVRERAKRHRVKEWDNITMHHFLDRYRSAYDAVLAELQTRRRLTVIRLRTDQDPVTVMADKTAAILGENHHAC